MPVGVQACLSFCWATFSAGLFLFSMGPLCHAGAWPALRGSKACSPIETMGQEPAYHQFPSTRSLET